MTKLFNTLRHALPNPPCVMLLLPLLAALCLLALPSCNSRGPHYRIGVSQCSTDSWREKLNMELQTSACVYGNISVEIATANDDSRRQQEQIEEFIRKKVDLLIVAPNTSHSITESVEKAYDAGIPVILVDRRVSTDKYTAYVGADNYDIGQTIGRYMCSVLGQGDTIVEFKGLEGSSPVDERHRGFAAAIAERPDLTVLDGGFTNWTEAGAEPAVRSYIERTGGRATAVFGHNDRIAACAHRLMGDLTGNTKCIYAGVDALATHDGGIRMVIDGVIDATCIYPTRGDMVMDVANKILHGQPFERTLLLSSALITTENADVVWQQTDDMDEMQERISVMSRQIDHYLEQFDLQKTFFLLTMVVVCLLALMAVYIYWGQHAKRQRAVAENEARLQFFTNVSHEFRTPLTLIADPLERLTKEEGLSPEGLRLLNMARRQTEVMLQLAGQILDLRKIQNQHMDVQTAPADLSVLIAQWVEDFSILGESRGLRFSIRAPQELVVETDAAKIERIVYNLVSNAVKYSPPQSTIDIELQKTPTGFALSVTDHGHGIAPEEQKRVFERFYQSKGSARGTGIGLALVHDLAEMLGGSVSLESEPGHGATFRVELPAQTDTNHGTNHGTNHDGQNNMAHTTIVAAPTSTKPAALSDEDADRETILVADDNADIRNYLQEILSADDFRVLTAEDGLEALRLAQEQVPDLVVSDVMMPGMNGRELCQKIKEHTATSHIPVILLTALAADEKRADGYDAGADAYIAKPFSTAVLCARVKNLIRSRKKLREIFAPNSAATLGQQKQQEHSATKQETALPATPDSTSETAPAAAPIATSASISASAITSAESLKAEERFMKRLNEVVEANMGDTEFSVETLAAELSLSRIQMYRKVKALTGTSPVDIIRMARLRRADTLLRQGGVSVSEAAYTVGFSSPSYFTKCYKDFYHRTPSEQ